MQQNPYFKNVELLLNGKVWKEFGIVCERGQGNELFIFDSAVGLNLIDNVGHLHSYGETGTLCGNNKVVNFPIGETLDQLDEFLCEYFFGVASESIGELPSIYFNTQK